MTEEQEFERRRWIGLALLCVAQFVVVLDASIVNVALPTIGDSPRFLPGQPLLGRQRLRAHLRRLPAARRAARRPARPPARVHGRADPVRARLARRRLRRASGVLIAARAVQGLGAAILSPAALSIVTTTFRDGAERNKALGAWGAVAGSGGAAGVLLGGVLTEYAGWEWVLWVNVPIGIGAALLAPRLLAESRSDSRRLSFDFAGAIERHRRPRDARLRAGRGAQRGLGLDPDDRPAGAGGRRCSASFVRDRAPLGRRRWCRSRSSASGR